MFKKSILQLHLKDKLFFLLVAILAIGGIYLGAKTAISYLSNPLEDHKDKLNETKNQVTQIEKKYSEKLNNALDSLTNVSTKLEEGWAWRDEHLTKENFHKAKEDFDQWLRSIVFTYIGLQFFGSIIAFVFSRLICYFLLPKSNQK